MNTSLIAAAAAFLNVLPGSVLNFRTGSGGLNNRSYRFEADGISYFLRVPTPASRRVSSVANEIAMYAALAESGISDRVIRIDPKSGMKLSVFEPNVRTLNPQNGSELTAALAALKKLHLLSVPGLKKETILERTHRFDRLASENGIRIAPDLRCRMETIWELEPLLNDRPLVPIHGDALPENVLIRPDGTALLIDFEFAALGDPLEDLAALYCHLPIGTITPEKILRSYLNRTPSQTEINLLLIYAQLIAVGWHLWAQIKIQAEENVEEIMRYDHRMIDFTTRQPMQHIQESLFPGG